MPEGLDSEKHTIVIIDCTSRVVLEQSRFAYCSVLIVAIISIVVLVKK